MIKKKIPWMIFFLIIAGLSVWAVTAQSKNFSMADLIREVQNGNTAWLVAACISTLGFIFFEGLAITVLVRGLVPNTRHTDGTLYAAADVYFSAITPSASGGQPASAMFMIMDGIPGAKSAVILLVNLILYTAALCACGIVAIIFRWRIFFDFAPFAKFLIIAGIVILIGLAVLFGILLRKERILHVWSEKFIRLGAKLHLVKHPDQRIDKLEHTMQNYKECAGAVAGKTKMLVVAFIFNLLQRVTVSLVTPFVYLALGGRLSEGFTTWAVQIFASLGSNCIPIPGAIGVADYLLLDGLGEVDGVVNVTNLELVSRGLSFYVCIIISLIIIIAGYIRRQVKKYRSNKHENK